MTAWTTANIPAQAGKRAIVTGATGGLGYETALGLAAAGADVILSGRNPAKGQAALDKIRALHPAATARFEQLDLASLDSVAAFAERMQGEGRPIDVLINNAGVMGLPRRQTTADGFEMQFGTNYLGHYALTARLLPLLRQADRPRVIQVSSVTHHGGRINFDDLQSERRYRPLALYGDTKLAMLMFALELQRRSDAAGWGLVSNAAHPGWARTDLIDNGPGTTGVMARAMKLIVAALSQSAAEGALPILYAATDPAARGGAYYGPHGFREMKGFPAKAAIANQAHDMAAAARLWAESERLTGVSFASRAA